MMRDVWAVKQRRAWCVVRDDHGLALGRRGGGGGRHLCACIAATEQDYNLARFDDLSGLGSHFVNVVLRAILITCVARAAKKGDTQQHGRWGADGG